MTSKEPASEYNFLTTNEIAEKLRVDRRTFLALIGSGEFPAYKVGIQYRISPTGQGIRSPRRARAGQPGAAGSAGHEASKRAGARAPDPDALRPGPVDRGAQPGGWRAEALG